jgi:NADH dehydrogenase
MLITYKIDYQSMKNIVILGGGYAGIIAAANLINKRGDVKIIVIDKNPYHQLLQQIHLIPANIKNPEYPYFED